MRSRSSVTSCGVKMEAEDAIEAAEAMSRDAEEVALEAAEDAKAKG